MFVDIFYPVCVAVPDVVERISKLLVFLTDDFGELSSDESQAAPFICPKCPAFWIVWIESYPCTMILGRHNRRQLVKVATEHHLEMVRRDFCDAAFRDGSPPLFHRLYAAHDVDEEVTAAHADLVDDNDVCCQEGLEITAVRWMLRHVCEFFCIREPMIFVEIRLVKDFDLSFAEAESSVNRCATSSLGSNAGRSTDNDVPFVIFDEAVE